jgi:hypothetical protein
VRAEVFDPAGRRVKTLLDGPHNGLVRISWDGSLDSAARRRRATWCACAQATLVSTPRS